jgi:hypothetical protein
LELSVQAGVVLDDQIDLLAADGRAVLVHVLLDAGLHLLADRGEPAGERQHQADLGGVLGDGASRRDCARGRCKGDGEISAQHRVSSLAQLLRFGGNLYAKTPRVMAEKSDFKG